MSYLLCKSGYQPVGSWQPDRKTISHAEYCWQYEHGQADVKEHRTAQEQHSFNAACPNRLGMPAQPSAMGFSGACLRHHAMCQTAPETWQIVLW